MSRRDSRSAIPERLKEAARDDSSDDEWHPDEAAGASDEDDSDADDTVIDGRWRREARSRDGALYRAPLFRPGGGRRPAQDPGREDLGTSYL